MKNKFFVKIALFGLAVVVLSSCSKMPQPEIDAANTAIDQAKEDGADIYAHDAFVALQDSMNHVMVAVEAQSSKFFKNYTSAKEGLTGVVQFAGEVEQKAIASKEELKNEIENTITEVKTLIESNRQLILEAPKGKEGTSALLAIKGENDAIESSLAETTTLFETGDYFATLDKAKAAKEKATEINNELSGIIAKYKANVKGRR